MFAKGSRYRKLPEVVATDASGLVLKSVDIRPLPTTTGALFHLLAEGERLDHLADKYYRQPRKWWQICDANPDFLSPLALLGQEPIITVRFPLTVVSADGQPPWDELLRALAAKVGVEDIQVLEDVQLVSEQQQLDGQTISCVVDRYERAVTITFNQTNITKEALTDAINSIQGFKAGEPEAGKPERIDRIGQRIAIPADMPV